MRNKRKLFQSIVMETWWNYEFRKEATQFLGVIECIVKLIVLRIIDFYFRELTIAMEIAVRKS